MNRWLLTLLVTVGLWAGYRGYALWVRPLTQPLPKLDVTPATESLEIPQTPADFATVERFLKGADWATKADYQIALAGGGSLFFNEYDLDGERVSFRPFAMVFRLDGQQTGTPYVVQCGGAHLTFERPLKLQSKGEGPGRILAAVLEGDFNITGPNSLTIKGRDCRFTEDSHQLYSDHKIEFSYIPDNSQLRIVRGTADKLQLDFLPATYSRHRDLPRVGDIASLTLRRDVRLTFSYDQGGQPESTRVTSDGPFTFDFTRNLATFQEKVHVARPTKNPDGSDGYDDLVTHWLGLQFEPRPPDMAATQPPSPAPTRGGGASQANASTDDDSPLGQLRFRGLRALGKAPQPGKNPESPAVVTSTASRFTATMYDLQYDAIERRLDLADPHAGVRLRNDDMQMNSPQLHLRHDADGELTYMEAAQRGEIHFTRPGTEGEPPQQFDASWARQMTLQPVPAEEIVVITLDGDARVVQPGNVGLIANRLTLDVDARRLESGQGPLKPAGGATTSTGELPLKHALAEGNVGMKGAQFEIETNRLDVTFRPGRLPKGPTGKPSMTPLGSASPAAQPAIITRHWQRVSAQPSPASTPGFGSVPLETALVLPVIAVAPSTGLGPNDHWDVKADGIEAIVLQDPDTDQSELQEVIGIGSVEIHQLAQSRAPATAPPQPTEEPLTVTGERLHLVNAGGIDQTLHLTGRPAHLRRAGVHIEGDELLFDREANTASVVGKGMMESPVKAGLNGEVRDNPSKLTIVWLRKMTFDGTLATYVEGVTTRIDDSVMRCDEMQVTLNQRIDFSSDRPDTTGLSIQHVLCERGVEFEYVQWGPDEDLLGRSEGKADEFELRYDTGDFEARGGGRLWVSQKNEDSRVEVEPEAAQANQPSEAAPLPWQFTEVIFHDRIVGNIQSQHATLYDRVWVTHAPVERPMQRFTRDELSRDTESARNAIWLGSDELTISLHPWATPRAGDEPERDSYVQILAVGKLARVELEGRLFQANADTLAYDESTKLFTLKGLGRNPVSVAMQDRPGAPYRETSGQTLRFNPGRRTASVEGSRGAFGTSQ